MRKSTMILLASALTACQPRPAPDESADNAPTESAEAKSAPAAPDNFMVNSAMPASPAPLAEPKGPIDPKSSEAAGQVVQHYGALIEQKKFGDAAGYWNDAQSAAEFAREFKFYREVYMGIGDLGTQEGAAGSIYITQPVTFYGKTASGADFSRKAVVTLRRVNDVPGSTEQQRRWHIQSIDWP